MVPEGDTMMVGEAGQLVARAKSQEITSSTTKTKQRKQPASDRML